MKRLTGKEEDEIFNDLKGVIFLNPLYNGNDDNQVKPYTPKLLFCSLCCSL